MFARLKILYQVYNFFQKKKIIHNVGIYKRLGLDKKYYSSISSKDFKDVDSNALLNNDTNKNIKETQFFKKTSAENQENILQFNSNGFAIINNYLDHKQVDSINNEIDTLLKSKKIKYRYGNKIMFAIHQSKLLKELGNDSDLLMLLSNLLNGNAQLFQSINFLMGSQQKTHSDSIHMTTFPLGGLLGVWIALEDIDLDNGPLHYYKASHTLPYYLNSDYNNEGNNFLLGANDYTAYEKMLNEKIALHKIEKQIFKAKKGDLFIWHANLLHGGEPHTNKEKTRKSMVFHYYNNNCICYHEITQRPALLSTI